MKKKLKCVTSLQKTNYRWEPTRFLPQDFSLSTECTPVMSVWHFQIIACRRSNMKTHIFSCCYSNNVILMKKVCQAPKELLPLYLNFQCEVYQTKIRYFHFPFLKFKNIQIKQICKNQRSCFGFDLTEWLLARIYTNFASMTFITNDPTKSFFLSTKNITQLLQLISLHGSLKYFSWVG